MFRYVSMVHEDFEPKADEGMRRVAARLRAQLARVRSGQAPAPTATEDRGSCSSVGIATSLGPERINEI